MEDVHEVEVKSYSDPPAGPSSLVFCRPEWISTGKKIFFFKSINIVSCWKAY